MEISEDGELLFEIGVIPVIGYIFLECTKKRRINVEEILASSGTV